MRMNSSGNAFEFRGADSSSRRWTGVLLALIVLLGAHLRLDASLKTIIPYPVRADAAKYFSYAFNLRHYGVYSQEPTFAADESVRAPKPDAIVAPGYPAMLWFFANAAPTGRTVLNIALVQALLGTLMIPLVFATSRRFLPRVWPLLPALLTAISPHLVNAGIYVLSEILFSFLLMAAILCMARQFSRTQGKLLPVLSGILIGLAALTRPTLQYFLPIMLVLVLPLLRKQQSWRQAIWMSAGFVLVMGPWLARNMLVLGAMSDPTLTISTLVHGHYPGMMFDGRPETLGYPYRFDPQVAQMSTSVGAAINGIWARAIAHPGEYLEWYLVGKPLAFFSWSDVAASREIFTYTALYSPYYDVPFFVASMALMRATHWAWTILAALAVAYSFLRKPVRGQMADNQIVLRMLASVWVYFLLVHIAGFPISRYNTPLLPVTYMLAAFALMKIVRWTMARASGSAMNKHGA